MNNRWEPFQRASYATSSRTVADAISRLDLAADEIFVNNIYQVAIFRQPDLVHLSIKRRDKKPIHDWRDLQRIKNELVGAECEAVELYPAESRLVDTANQYHLFCVPDPTYRFPVGFVTRMVSNISEHGCVQRPFPLDAMPPDCKTFAEHLREIEAQQRADKADTDK